jgi:hypothetical protein
MMKLKIRMMIDRTGEIFLVILGRPIDQDFRIALNEGNQLTDYSSGFEELAQKGFGLEGNLTTSFALSDLC